MVAASHKEIRPELMGVLLIAGSLLLGTSLASYNPQDPSPFIATTATEVHNLMGRVGAFFADTLFSFLGTGTYLIPIFMLYLGLRRLFRKERSFRSRTQLVLGNILLLLSVPLISQLNLVHLPLLFDTQSSGIHDAGGLTGQLLEKGLVKLFAPLGTQLIAWTMLLMGILMTTRLSLRMLLSQAVLGIETVVDALRSSVRAAENSIEKIQDRAKKQKSTPKPTRVIQEPPKILQNPVKTVAPSPPRQETLNLPPQGENYLVPPLSLLNDAPGISNRHSKEDLLMNSKLLERRFQDFSVEGHVTAVHPGPVVTLFEYQPAPGVKLQKIVNLADDLALSMKAMSVRIVAPIPGKSTVGIEVPNTIREDVCLKEILASEVFQETSAATASTKESGRSVKLALALGKDIFGTPIVTDLKTLPHLLIAGATGSGKSVAINALILSLLAKVTPQEVRFLMIDPKRLELACYDNIPHLVAPVIYKPKDASRALNRMVDEMQRRYRLLAEQGARSIESYNQKRPKDEPALPYIVIIVDELADLMMVSAKEVEDSLMRLAQMARAAGIHLILATQRPSVDVLTGVIKANFSARISFQVSSKTDSRTILDGNGAEQLLGKGDMLFMSPSGAKLTRVHGAFVSDGEIQKMVEFIKSQGKPEYMISLTQEANPLEPLTAEDERDERYQQAVQLVITTGQASASFIQRRLRVGYPRAARMIEIMEEDGIVGPPAGSKAREVYAKQLDPSEIL